MHSFVVNFSPMQTLYCVLSSSSPALLAEESDILKVNSWCLKEPLSSKISEVEQTASTAGILKLLNAFPMGTA